jgi:hypothetical protein
VVVERFRTRVVESEAGRIERSAEGRTRTRDWIRRLAIAVGGIVDIVMGRYPCAYESPELIGYISNSTYALD